MITIDVVIIQLRIYDILIKKNPALSFQKILEGTPDSEKEIFAVLSDVLFSSDIDGFIREIPCLDTKSFVCAMFHDGGVPGFLKNHHFLLCKLDIAAISRRAAVKLTLQHQLFSPKWLKTTFLLRHLFDHHQFSEGLNKCLPGSCKMS